MPGRKSDIKDAQWIACLLHKGMLRGSMIPSPTIQQLRVYSRKYTKLQEQKTRSLQKMNRIMVMYGFRIGSCMSNLGTKSVMNIISSLIKGESKPEELCKLIYGNTANKKSGIFVVDTCTVYEVRGNCLKSSETPFANRPKLLVHKWTLRVQSEAE